MAWRADAKRLFQVTLGTSPATLYTVPANQRAIIKEIHLINYSDAGPVYPTLWVVPSGQSRTDARIFLPPFCISARGVLSNVFSTMLHAGDTIDGQADVASRANVYGSGVEMISVT